jgi:hypothetical protein
MSVIVVKVKNENNVSVLKKLIGIFKEKVHVYEDEEYRDKIASELMDEGLKTRLLTEEETRKEFRKRGVTY